MPKKSFDALESSVEPGGARKAAFYVRATLDEIKRDLVEDIAYDLYLLCWYGETVVLHVHQHGDRTVSIDLHPFIKLRIEGIPEITFEDGHARGYDFSSDAVEEGSLAFRMFGGEFVDSVVVDVDWSKVVVPALEGDVVTADDLVNVEDEWMSEEEEAKLEKDELIDEGYVPYGHTDLEE